MARLAAPQIGTSIPGRRWWRTYGIALPGFDFCRRFGILAHDATLTAVTTEPPNLSPAADHTHLAFDHVDMAFGERQVFADLSFSFPSGRISVILGGSGSGKSTALRLIGGLIQ